MNLIEDDIEISIEFEQKMLWYEEEFDLIFNNNSLYDNEQNKKLANQLLGKLSETINEYRDQKVFHLLVHTLNNIERNHPEFFE